MAFFHLDIIQPFHAIAASGNTHTVDLDKKGNDFNLINPKNKKLEGVKGTNLNTQRKGSVVYMVNNKDGSGSSSPPPPTPSSKKGRTIVIDSHRLIYKKVASTLYSYT